MPASGTQAPRIDHNLLLNDGASDTGLYIEDVAGTGEYTGLIEDNEFQSGGMHFWALVAHTGAKVVSPTIRNNTFSDADVSIDLTAKSSAQGTVAPMITGNHTTGTQYYDLYWFVATSEDGLEFSPTVSGNSFS